MNHGPPIPNTIFVTYHGHSRFGRIKLRYPGVRPRLRLRIRTSRATVRILEHPASYDAGLAMELLANTCELPDRKRDLQVVVGEYRRALHALATQACASQQPAAR